MGKIKIVTDSTCYMDKEYALEEKVSVVPLNYVFDGESFVEGFKGEFDEFFKKMETTDLFPTTSQPAAGDFFQVYTKAFEEGYDEIIVIVLSSKLSGTYNSAILAKNMLEDKMISIIDSESAASNMRFLVEDAVNMAKEGKSGKEIVEFIEKKKKTMDILITPWTLEYLARGGRMSSLQSAIGNILNIKPIIKLIDGKLELLEKVRGRNNALTKVMSYIPDDVEKISICHILNLVEALKIKGSLEKKYPQAIITVDDLGPVIGSHLGPKTIGFCFY
ncbi:MAG TPA: DegV family protein [Tissierellaceae bacterium]|nr:DegV family protein [Tissierellaceae bacterium]